MFPPKLRATLKVPIPLCYQQQKLNLCSAFMEYAGLERLDSNPKQITSSDPKDLERIIGCFLDEYVRLEFDVEKAPRQQKEQVLQTPQAEAAVTERFQQSPIHSARTELNTCVIIELWFYLHYYFVNN